ncbi:hypothetical protein OIU85_018719 [Salix viminalis]|uniref:Uncharacterized protein n=1 Tax=Salix viminalis TaxID=40686 RepID=A0A9Q0UUB7_SALVM|nr:hypothetical protein OIU85_018719 [Salix viminalis]
MSNRSRRKIHSQTSNQKPRQKQPGLLREESKQQQQQQSSQEHPTQGQQNPVAISDEPPQQLLPQSSHVVTTTISRDNTCMAQREKKLQSLTSFLYSENSFLTPWSWNPEAPRPEEKRPMMFQPGSFFSYHIPPPQAKVEEQHSRQSQTSKQP